MGTDGADAARRRPPRRSIEVAAEQRRQVVGVVQRRPHAERREEALRGRDRGRGRQAPGGRGAARRRQRYLARELRRERGHPGRRQLAQRRVRVLHQCLVCVRLPRAATCNHHCLSDRASPPSLGRLTSRSRAVDRSEPSGKFQAASLSVHQRVNRPS